MIPFVVLLLAALSRFVLPALSHSAGFNLTMVGAGLLFFGSRSPRWQAFVAAGVMAVTDVVLTTYVYHYPFHVSGYLVTWAWYAAASLLGTELLRKVTTLRVVAGVFASATSFFLLSNFVVWMGHMYDHSIYGLGMCYASALPFYRNDLVSTGLFAGILFGLPVVAARLVESMQPDTRVRVRE